MNLTLQNFINKRTFNWAINIAMIVIVMIGNIQSGFFTLGSLVSTLGLIGTIGLAYKWKYNFHFNGVQNLFAFIQGWKSKLFGDALVSLFYFLTQFVGSKNWGENIINGKLQIEKKSNWKIIIYSIIVGFFLLGGISILLDGDFIFLDSLNNSSAMVAHYLQMKRHRSSWYIWLFTNVIGVIIWIGVGVPAMAAMYLAFSLNSIRGAWNWKD